MSTTRTVFVTGGTGYIGGTVLEKFLSLPGLSISALVRTSEKAKKFEEFGVKPILGSLDDLQLLEEQAAQADLVIEMADCDHFAAHEALLRGAKKRFEATGKKPTYINTSGTACFITDFTGEAPPAHIYDDMKPEEVEALPIQALHRPVDSMVSNADGQGYVDTYNIVPGTVWGIAKTKFVDAGIQSPLSIQVPFIVEGSVDRGQAGFVGKALNVWPHVEVHELGDLYITLYNAIFNTTPRPTALGKGKEGYYFGATEEFKLRDIYDQTALVLHSLGKSKSPEPTAFTAEDIQKHPGLGFLATNSRAVGNRGRALGWKPVKTVQDMIASVEPEVKLILETKYSARRHVEKALERAKAQ